MNATINTTHVMPNHLQSYTGFWKRVVAAIVDNIILYVLIAPPLIAIYGWGYFNPEGRGFIVGPADFILAWIFPMVFAIGFWMWKQATLGKMAISTKIVDATTGDKPTTKQWIIRYFGYFVSMIPLGLGLFWVAFDKRKQGWHDKMAGTVVIPSTNGSL